MTLNRDTLKAKSWKNQQCLKILSIINTIIYISLLEYWQTCHHSQSVNSEKNKHCYKMRQSELVYGAEGLKGRCECPSRSRGSTGGVPEGKAPKIFRVFEPKYTLDRLISSPFQNQNIKNEHIINVPLSQNLTCLVLKVPYWQFCVHFERQLAYKTGLNFVIV